MPLPNKGVYVYPSTRGYSVRGTGVPRDATAVYHQKWTNPVASALNNYRTNLAGPNTATILLTPNSSPALDGTLVTGITGGKRAIPDFARNVVITVTHGSAVVAESGVITGLDTYGRLTTEAWAVTAGTVSKTFTGKKAYREIISVSITAAADATANTNQIGTGVVFGLDVAASLGGAGAAIKELSGGAILTTGTLVAASAVATDDAIGTYAPVAAPNGATTYEAWYLSDNPESS